MNSAGDKHSIREVEDSEQQDIADITDLDLLEDTEISTPDVTNESAETPLSDDNKVNLANNNTDKTQIFQAPDFIENQIEEFALEPSPMDEVTQIMDVANIFGSHPSPKEEPEVNIHATKIHSAKNIKKALTDSNSSTNSEDAKQLTKDPKPLVDSAKAHQKVKKLENRASDNNKKETHPRQRKEEPSSQVSSNMSANNKTIIQKPFKKPVAPKQHEAKNENSVDPAGINAKSVEQSQYDITLTPKPLQDKSKLSNNKTPIAEKNSAISKVGLNLKHRFKLIEHIGDGGMSQVYKARDLRLEAAGIENPYIAIKILSDEFGSHPEALKVMARECQKTRELCHPNIVRVFDYDTDNDINFITMELLEGESLDKVIQRAKPRGLAMKGVISILEPLCRALEYAHQHGIVHADLKPSNIFLTRSGEVKIFDFGVVRALNNQPDQYSAKNLQRDDNPKTGGYTPAYASIEMLNGGEPDLRDDLYALGCISYELITSRHPFNRTPANQIKQNEVNLTRPKNISGTKWKAIRALLSLNKEARPISALVFLQQMQRNPIKLPLKIAASLAVVGTLAFYANDYNQTFLQINAAHDSEIAKSRLITDLKNASKSEIISQYQQLEKVDEVTRLAFLQAFRKEIIEHYLTLIQTKKMSSDEKFPDFVAQLSTIDEIQAVYGDSLKLENKRQDILTSRTHLIQAKEYKFNNLLRQQQYYSNQQDEDIFSLLANMRSMKPGYQPKIADDIFQLYGESVNAAVLQQNYMLVESLMRTGNIIFPQHPEYLKLAGKGEQYHQAAKLLADYQASLETDSPLEFPHKEATIFYTGLIEDLSQLVDNAESKNNLDDIFEKVTEWSSKLPATFRPLDDVRKQLSGSYMSRANKLIKQGKVKSASPLFDKAEKLLSYN